MKKSIKYSIAAAALGVAAITTFGVGTVMAQSGVANPVKDAFRTQVFEKVVTKLNLNVSSDQLQTAFSDTMKEEMQAQFKTQLDAAVTSGKITQETANNAMKIEEARRTFMDSQIKLSSDELDNLSRGELRAKMTENSTKLEKAIQDSTGLTNDQIKSVQSSLRDAGIKPFGIHGKGHGKMRGMMRGEKMGF